MKNINPSIFMAYDIRGIYPQDLDEEIAYRIGQAYAQVFKPKNVALGRDVRVHGQKLWQAVANGLTDAGVDVVDIGMISTEVLYFAVGGFGYDGGITISASHNPAEWNGLKMVGQGARPISSDTGINQIKDLVISDENLVTSTKGSVAKNDRVLDEYCRFVLTFADTNKLKPIKIVANPNFGMSGIVLDRLVELGRLPIEVVKLNYHPDGTFPKGRPDPFLAENRPEVEEWVKKNDADLGVAWDADGDRVFFVTAQGDFIEPVYISAILAKPILKRYPNSKIVFDVRYIYALETAIEENGGEPILTRAGHSFIKQKMREVEASWAGESTAHYYYKDNYYADSGMITLIIMLEYLATENISLSGLVEPWQKRFFVSGEINFKVEETSAIMKKIESRYRSNNIDKTDGVTIEGRGWRANIRTSNTEPLLRLNIESKNSLDEMNQKVAEFTKLIEN